MGKKHATGLEGSVARPTASWMVRHGRACLPWEHRPSSVEFKITSKRPVLRAVLSHFSHVQIFATL